MRAVIRERYGPPDVLELKGLEKAEPADDEVLVRVRAASVNRADEIATRSGTWAKAMLRRRWW